MSKPTKLCYLQKGKALGAFDGFVDTWNWIVNFCSNLRGEGDQDPDKSLKVDRTEDDYPIITGGGSEITVVGTDGSSAVATGTITFASAADSNVTATVSKSGDNVTVTLGAYWVDVDDSQSA